MSIDSAFYFRMQAAKKPGRITRAGLVKGWKITRRKP
jgi:hypothetical protein